MSSMPPPYLTALQRLHERRKGSAARAGGRKEIEREFPTSKKPQAEPGPGPSIARNCCKWFVALGASWRTLDSAEPISSEPYVAAQPQRIMRSSRHSFAARGAKCVVGKRPRGEAARHARGLEPIAGRQRNEGSHGPETATKCLQRVFGVTEQRLGGEVTHWSGARAPP
jgi:hypothetical protein